MELADILKIALGIIGILVMVFCGVVWSEIKRLRRQGHKHANALTALNLGASLICNKLGIQWYPGGKEDE